MSLKGLSKEELFDLKRSIGNNKSGFDPALGPKEVAAILEKAEKFGNSTKEISKFLNLKTIESGTTMITRTKRLFKKLNSELHGKVVYKSHSSKNKSKSGHISFQSAVELSRFNKDEQIDVFNQVVKNKFSKENIKTLIHYTKKAGMSLEDAVEKLKSDKGISSFQTVSKEINLKELNEKIYQLKQDERNKLFKDILKDYLNDQLKEIHLGVFTYSFTFKSVGEKIKPSELQNVNEKILEGIKNYA